VCTSSSTPQPLKAPPSGIAWSTTSADLLLIGLENALVHLWDVRRPGSATMTFGTASGGGGDVEWSRCKENLFAAACGNAVALWDVRMPSNAPMRAAVHDNHVTSIDWSPR
jgi:WD40 repeat protein